MGLRTVDNERGRIGGGSGRVLGGAHVVTGVLGRDGRDHEHANTIGDLFNQHPGRTADLLAGIGPAYLEGQVANRHDALEIGELAGVHR